MTLDIRINAFVNLGEKISNLTNQELSELTAAAKLHNPWFDRPNVNRAFSGISYMLQREKLANWTRKYSLTPDVPKIVGIIMAGNIPLVGFHDFISVLLSGHIAAVKMSSQDSYLTQKIIDWLVEIEPRFKKSIQIHEKLETIDSVICTGSDNTARYFKYYFGKYPNIIRKNRTSVAVLDGTETAEELKALGEDIFSYFGLGCRNISKLMVPEGYDFTALFPHFEEFSEVIYHNKYKNNYDYNKAIYLVNKEKHLDNGFLLIKPDEQIVSPTAVLYQESYSSPESVNNWISSNVEKIQCVIGHNHIPFGMAQSPEPWDYADGVDTLKFLSIL